MTDTLERMIVEQLRAARMLYAQGQEDDAQNSVIYETLPLILQYVTDDDEGFEVFEVLQGGIMPAPPAEA